MTRFQQETLVLKYIIICTHVRACGFKYLAGVYQYVFGSIIVGYMDLIFNQNGST